MDEISLRVSKISNISDYIDYDIVRKKTKIGMLQTVENSKGIFCRRIHIGGMYQRRGYATKTLELLLKEKKQDIKICISLHSKSAVKFWDYFLSTHENENVRGDIYRLKYRPDPEKK